jgi:hypothetical protein
MNRTVKIWMVFTGVFLAGAVCGGVLSLRVAKSYIERGRGSDRFAMSMMERYAERLELTDAQREAIQPYINTAHEEVRRARRQTAETIRAMEEKISSELTDAQREELAAWQAEQRERWRRLTERREQERREGGPGPRPEGGDRPPPPSP